MPTPRKTLSGLNHVRICTRKRDQGGEIDPQEDSFRANAFVHLHIILLLLLRTEKQFKYIMFGECSDAPARFVNPHAICHGYRRQHLVMHLYVYHSCNLMHKNEKVENTFEFMHLHDSCTHMQTNEEVIPPNAFIILEDVCMLLHHHCCRKQTKRKQEGEVHNLLGFSFYAPATPMHPRSGQTEHQC